MSAPDHYAVLGVPVDADRETIRRAYVEIARATHPDRASGDPTARADASRAIRAANAAWNVLGDDARRAEYDRSRRGTSPPRVGSSPTTPRTRPVTGRPAPPEPVPTPTTGLAWVGLVGLLLAVVVVLVVSAYATSRDTGTTGGGPTTSARLSFAAGQCVDVSASPSGPVAVVSPCASAVTGRILSVVDTPRPCPVGTAVALADARTTLCLEQP